MRGEAITPGLMVLQGNRLEDLRDVLALWLRREPLAPLENEVVLVQSNGIAQWFKLALARPERDGGLGVAAAVDVSLPGRFLWNAYRAVLGDDLPETSPFDRSRLVWRLMRLVPAQMHKPAFATLRHYLADDDDLKKRHRVAERIADLYDQYQVYRADWLADWADRRNIWRDAAGRPHALPEAQAWQASLWRALLADVGMPAAAQHRGALQLAFVERLAAAAARPAKLPRRVVVFGISSLPRQTLEALHALSRVTQVLVVVANPCRYYWADIVEHRDLARAAARRQPDKPGMPVAPDASELHLHANPLLASWGKHGRDYLRLLDEMDRPDDYRERFSAWGRAIDLYGEPEARGLLGDVQRAILDLAPLPADPALRPVVEAGDATLDFHIAHSARRELEVLHDALLARMERAARDGDPLAPRDVIVMVPDIHAYAPLIRAVFGRYAPGDERYVPFAVADQRARGNSPLLVAVEHLLGLPESRVGASELVDLLDVPALRRRFGIDAEQLPLVRRWVEGAGIRWGLDAAQRASLGLPPLAQNTWRFGLRRMLLGYAVGDGAGRDGIDPYGEVGGLDAALVGALAQLVQTLERHWAALRTPASPARWAERLRALLDDCFEPRDDEEMIAHDRLVAALEHWQDACAEGELDEALPLAVVREAWLEGLDEGGLSQRFLSGGVAFATLMPMRAIPFRVIALLGMNDGDYPRAQPPNEFDLMAWPGAYRAGDRSRREDDRYLFLEALLSARHALHVSWVGRNVRDDSERPPSVLVGQLRDYLAAGWQGANGAPLLDALTTTHPLQPFSTAYFGGDARLYTYAREWREALAGADAAAPAELSEWTSPSPLTLNDVGSFLQRPVRYFFQQRLKVFFEDADGADDDQETFAFDVLDNHRTSRRLLDRGLAADDAAGGVAAVDAAAERLRRGGELPLAAFGELALAEPLAHAHEAHARAREHAARWPHVLPRVELSFARAGLRIEDWIADLRANDAGERVRIEAAAMPLSEGKTIKYHRCVSVWATHVVAHAAGLSFATWLVAPDAAYRLAPLDHDDALALVDRIGFAYAHGLRAPLPAARKTAFAWIAAEDRGADGAIKAASAYEARDFGRGGEASEDPYLARSFPDFAALHDAGFERWLDLYRPLAQRLQRGDDA
ncbi:exodeoxyribonuclease V subunit gamma [Tahibacter soli]|uniref:RecBCD enzyme subunit RecC n=1 Tax=Tahibacter soli TaxID=2983605 RepID=A0A9X3YM32_9GAMM|nr:exodeoxyribonuclease V subunit gamma [Tahibacter soli]MDC8013223.1 exodeoxyribonuclease V subunit gamma [Tahibacter soli]